MPDQRCCDGRAGRRQGTQSIARQVHFVTLRDEIERIASDVYDDAPMFRRYVVRIFTKHIWE